MATTSTSGSASATSTKVGSAPSSTGPDGRAPAVAGRRAGRPKRSPLAKREDRAGWLFISPWLIGFLIFTAGPMIASLVLSFTDYQMIRTPHGVGTANYQELIQDPRIAKSLLNTFIYALIFVPTGTVVALLLAMMLYRVGRGAGFFRTAFYLPV